MHHSIDVDREEACHVPRHRAGPRGIDREKRWRRAGKRRIFVDQVALFVSSPRFAPPAQATRGSPNVQAEPNISWTELTKFVGQLNHDLRNHLNAIELQAACLSDIVRDPESGIEISRLREMTGDLCAHLQRLSALLAESSPTRCVICAAEFVEDLSAKMAAGRAGAGRGGAVEDLVRQGSPRNRSASSARGVPRAVWQRCCASSVERASSFSNRIARANRSNSSCANQRRSLMAERKTGADDPLLRIRHGHYGLGLFRARSIFEAHHGTLRAEFDPAASTLTHDRLSALLVA